MRLNTDTQKNEAVNRSLSASVPKNVNYSRNFEGRVHSTVHRLNNQPGRSLEAKVKNIGCYLSPPTKHAVRQMDRECEYHKNYGKRVETRRRNMMRRGLMVKTHLEYRNMPASRKSDYRKGQLDSVQLKGDHSYCSM